MPSSLVCVPTSNYPQLSIKFGKEFALPVYRYFYVRPITECLFCKKMKRAYKSLPVCTEERKKLGVLQLFEEEFPIYGCDLIVAPCTSVLFIDACHECYEKYDGATLQSLNDKLFFYRQEISKSRHCSTRQVIVEKTGYHMRNYLRFSQM
jgi:hypothetical protein